MKHIILALALVFSFANTASASLVVDFAIESGEEGEGDESANSMVNCESAQTTAALCDSGEIKGQACAVAETVLGMCESF